MTAPVLAEKPTLDLWSPARLVHRSWVCYKWTREIAERGKAFEKEGPGLLQQRADLLQEMCDRTTKLFGMEIVVSGSPLPKPPYIMVCNHLGYMDPIILSAIQPCAPIAKRELGDWPAIGPALDTMGVMLVHRGNLHQSATVLRRAHRVLKAGIAVINFPEGTTTAGEEVLPFKRGIFGLARIANVPVVPARIDFLDPKDAWIGDDGFLGHYLRFGALPAHGVRMHITDPVQPRDYESAAAMAEAMRAYISQLTT